MNSAMETILVALAVAGALLYLARLAWTQFRGGGCCGKCPLKKLPLLACGMTLSLSVHAATLSEAQRQSAERIPALTLPTPAEFFAAIDKTGQPDWMSFYRDPVPTTYPTRPHTALNLGALVTDAYVAVEAQDGQQVKNIGKDIITLARGLGVGEDVLTRGKSISDFADKNDWFALREELDATTNDVRRAMIAQRDEALAALISAGTWIHAVQVGATAAALCGEPSSAALLQQPALLAWLRSQLAALPEKSRGGPVVTRTEMTLSVLEENMQATPLDETRVQAIRQSAAQLVTDMGSKEP